MRMLVLKKIAAAALGVVLGTWFMVALGGWPWEGQGPSAQPTARFETVRMVGDAPTSAGASVRTGHPLSPPPDRRGWQPSQEEEYVPGQEAGGQEHGPDAVCTQWCSPDGGRHEAPDGMPVVKCAGTGDGSCQKMGAQCGEEHRSGCSEFCRRQCCSCCSL